MAPPSKRLTASASRVLILTVVDQGASSISNFALALLVAHYSGAHELGVFSILSITYILTQGLARSISSDCLLTRSETDDEVMARFERGGYLMALVVATTIAVGLAIVGLGIGGDFQAPFVVLAVSFPFMAAQDFARFIGISRHDPAYALRLDVAWIIVFVAAYVVVKHSNHVSLPWLFATWTGAGGLVGIWTLRAHLSISRPRELLQFWMKSERAVGVRFAGQFMLTSSWAYTVFYLLAFVVSLDAVGVVRLAQLAIGPLTVASAGVQSAMIPIAAKRFVVDRRDALRFLLIAGGVTAVATAAWSLGAFSLPVHVGTKLFGPSWPGARKVVLYIGLGFVLGGFSGASNAGLRALRAANANLKLAAAMVPFTFIPGLGLAAVDGARGFAVGVAISFGTYAIAGWYVLIRASQALADHPAELVEAAPV